MSNIKIEFLKEKIKGYPVWIKETAVPLLLYIIITLLLMKDIFTKIYIIPTGDSYFSFYSWNTFFRNCIEKGIVPLWNPFVLCGHPYHLESVSNFSFSNILLFLFDVNHAWNIKLFFSNILSAFFMFLLLKKEIRISAIPAFLGGLIFMSISIDIFDKPYFYMPLIFILANKWVASKKFIWGSLLCLAIFLYFLNSNPQYVLYFCIFVFSYIFINLIKETKERRIGRILILVLISAAPFIMALGLASFRIIPMFELVFVSHRWVMGAIITLLSPIHLIQLLYPKFYMSSLCTDLNFLFDRVMVGCVSVVMPDKHFNFTSAPYIGIAPFILAALFFFKKGKSFHEKFFLFSSFAVLLYVVFNPLLYSIIGYLPLLNKMPFIERSYIIYNFSMVILAALAMDKMLSKDGLFLKVVSKIIFVFFAVITSFVLLRLAVFFILKVHGRAIEAALLNALPGIIQKHSVYHASPEFYHQRIQQAVSFLTSWASFGNLFFLIPTLMIVFSLVIIYGYIKDKIPKWAFLCLFSIVIAADFFMYFKIPAFSSRDIHRHSKIADFINQQPGIFRVMPLHKYDTKNPAPMDVQTFLRPESQLLYAISTPEGYRSLILERYIEILGLLVGQPSQELLLKIGEFDKIDENIADFMNIKYVVTFSKNYLNEGYKLIYQDGVHNVYENEDVLGRVFLVHNMEFVKQKEQILKKIKEGFDFKNNVLLEEFPVQLSNREDVLIKKSEVRIEKYEPNYISISLKNPKDGFLVLSDCYYPGWKAYIDGKQDKVLVANYAFRAVRVSAGSHIVEFKYSPSSFKLGLVISLSSLICGLIIFKLLSDISRSSQ